MKSEQSPRQLLAFTALLVTMLFWAGNAIVGRAIRGDVPAFMLALSRWGIAFAILLPFALRHLIADRRILLAEWKILLMLGLVGVASFNAFLYSGLHYTTAANASLLQAATPALVVLIDRLIFRERPTRVQFIGVLLSTIGVLVIISQGRLAALLGLHFGYGDVLILTGVFAWACYASLLKLRPDCHPLSFLAVTFAIAALAMMPLAASQWAEIVRIDWSPKVIGAIGYVAIFPSVIAYALFNFAVGEVGPLKAGQTGNLLPLFGVLLAVPLLDEPLHPYHGVGMALIAAGIGAGWLSGRKRA